MSVSIHKSNVRAGLEPRREPYWAAPLEPGRFIGFRKIDAQRGTWVARVRTEDAQQVYHALGAHSATFDFTAATKAARAWFADLDAGVVSRARFTLQGACAEYVEELRRGKRDKAAADAEWRFERSGITGEVFGRTELTKLRTPDLKRWRDALLTKDDEGRQMGKSGTNRCFAVLRAALNLAVQNNRAPAGAAQAWRAVKQFARADGRREIFLDIEQRRALLAAARGTVRDLIEAALLTGARPGELVSAPRSAFDARTRALSVAGGKTGVRKIPLAGATFALFERVAKAKLPTALLFARDDGQPWTRIEWSRQIRAAAAAAAVKDNKGNETPLPPGVCLYSCRHSYISQALKDGLTTLDVATLTGTSLQMIQAHYGHIQTDAVRERLDKVQML